jgi:hypothetical protein
VPVVAEDDVRHSSPARLTRRRLGVSPLGTLSLSNDGRLTFVKDGETTLDISVSEITKLWAPWFMVGGGFKFAVGPDTYICTFDHIAMSHTDDLAMAAVRTVTNVRPSGSAALKDSELARKLCREWKDQLKQAMS